MDGISFVVAFGAPQRPRFQRAGSFWRLVIGPVVFWLILRDFDKVVERIEATEKEVSLTRRENIRLSDKVEELENKNSRVSADYLKEKETSLFLDGMLSKKHFALKGADEKILKLQTEIEERWYESRQLTEALEEANYQLQLKAKKPTKKANRKRVR